MVVLSFHRLTPLLKLDPHIAKAPIILAQEKSDEDSVVKWIREEFSEVSKVRT